MTTDTHGSYRPYFVAWFVLLGITVVMLFLQNPAVLIMGISLKAAIIGLWFMHLRQEHADLTAWIAVGLFGSALILFLLIVPDGMAM